MSVLRDDTKGRYTNLVKSQVDLIVLFPPHLPSKTTPPPSTAAPDDTGQQLTLNVGHGDELTLQGNWGCLWSARTAFCVLL